MSAKKHEPSMSEDNTPSEDDTSLSDREDKKLELASQMNSLYRDLLTRWEKAIRDMREEIWVHRAAHSFGAESQEDFKRRLNADVAAEEAGYQERREKIMRMIKEL